MHFFQEKIRLFPVLMNSMSSLFLLKITENNQETFKKRSIFDTYLLFL